MEDTLPDKGHFVFYGNSSKTLGAGHIMRLFALAQTVQQAGFRITFIYKQCTSSLLEKLSNENFSTLQFFGAIEADFIAKLKPSCLVIDDYHLSSEEWQNLKSLLVFKLLFDDELNQAPLYADLIVNPSPNAKLENYNPRAPNAHFCLGPKYTILRNEFKNASKSIKDIHQRKHILITLGGSDIKALAYPICNILLSYLEGVELILLIGNTHHSQLKQLQQLVQQHKSFSLSINSSNIAQLMSESGMAITGAGGTLGELAAMGVPSIALVYVDNQLSALTSVLNGSWYQAMDFRDHGNSAQDQVMLNKLALTASELWQDKFKRVQMSQKAQQIVDTGGCQLILGKVTTLLKNEQIERHYS